MQIKSINNYFNKNGLQSFDCGNQNLNTYLKRYAGTNELMGLSRTFLLLDGFTIVGYYTTTTASIGWSVLDKELRAKMPKYDIPVIRIARLAVDLNYQRKGYGSYMLIDIAKRVKPISQMIGIYGIMVDAKPEAIPFYEKYGFRLIPGTDNVMLVPLNVFEKLDQ